MLQQLPDDEQSDALGQVDPQGVSLGLPWASAPKTDINFSVFPDLHFEQGSVPFCDWGTSSSNTVPQSRHLYSNIGIGSPSLSYSYSYSYS